LTLFYSQNASHRDHRERRVFLLATDSLGPGVSLSYAAAGTHKQVLVKQLIADSSKQEAGRLGSQEAGKPTKMGGARASEFFSLQAS